MRYTECINSCRHDIKMLYDKEYTLSISKQAEEIKGDTFNPFPEPFRSKLGQSECKSLGDEFGLTQFGVNLELLQVEIRFGQNN